MLKLELYYWPMLPGRGEFRRLLLEDGNVPYVDVARESEDAGGGIAAVMRIREAAELLVPPFAPPILKVGDLVIAQTAVVCEYVAELAQLHAKTRAQHYAARQHMLAILDIVGEVHDTHHPLATSLAFEQQRAPAIRASNEFLNGRLQTRLAYFERVITASARGWLVGETITYPDFALFQLLSGLHYAFPCAMSKVIVDYPFCVALHDSVQRRPSLAGYLASTRRLPFNQYGIFRHYPELDLTS